MNERTVHMFVRGLMVVLPMATTMFVLVAMLEIAGKAPQPQVIVMPEAAACGAIPEPTPEPAVQRAPASVEPPTLQTPAPSPQVILLETSNVTEWLGVVDIRRAEVERILSGPDPFDGARILPYERNGRPVGFQIYGVRQSSGLRAMGIRNGDIVHEINGRSLTSPDTTLNLYFSRPQYFDIRLTRRGQPARLLVVIHEHPREMNVR